MTYIILAAGKGAGLQPFTLKTPKPLYKLDSDTTVLRRTVTLIRQFDPNAEIVVVAGFMYDQILRQVERENVTIVRNPFYAATGSISSLWFAKKYLERDNIAILNADIVTDSRLVEEVICKSTDRPYVLIDSSRTAGRYNVQINGDRICVISKALSSYYAQYASITKLDAVSARFLMDEIDNMVNSGMYDRLFEDALVQMIFENDFELYYKDIKDYAWAEIDTVDDLLKAREVQNSAD